MHWTVKDEQKRKDGFVILEMMKKASGEKPKMWGSSLIGFGKSWKILVLKF